MLRRRGCRPQTRAPQRGNATGRVPAEGRVRGRARGSEPAARQRAYWRRNAAATVPEGRFRGRVVDQSAPPPPRPALCLLGDPARASRRRPAEARARAVGVSEWGWGVGGGGRGREEGVRARARVGSARKEALCVGGTIFRCVQRAPSRNPTATSSRSAVHPPAKPSRWAQGGSLFRSVPDIRSSVRVSLSPPPPAPLPLFFTLSR